MPGSTRSQPPKLLDQVRQVLRLHHYSIHTERAYLEWIVRYVRFHRMRSRDDLFPPEPNIEAFLTHLAALPGHAGQLRGCREKVEQAMGPLSLVPGYWKLRTIELISIYGILGLQ